MRKGAGVSDATPARRAAISSDVIGVPTAASHSFCIRTAWARPTFSRAMICSMVPGLAGFALCAASTTGCTSTGRPSSVSATAARMASARTGAGCSDTAAASCRTAGATGGSAASECGGAVSGAVSGSAAGGAPNGLPITASGRMIPNSRAVPNAPCMAAPQAAP